MNEEEKIKELKNTIKKYEELQIDIEAQIKNTKKQLKKHLRKKRVKISCCGENLGDGRNIRGYKGDYRCWEYICPICDNRYYLYDYKDYEEEIE